MLLLEKTENSVLYKLVFLESVCLFYLSLDLFMHLFITVVVLVAAYILGGMFNLHIIIEYFKEVYLIRKESLGLIVTVRSLGGKNQHEANIAASICCLVLGGKIWSMYVVYTW